MTLSSDDITVTGRPTLSGSIVIRKSLLKPTDMSCGRGQVTPGLDHASPHVSNVFDGEYVQTRQNPLYCSDSEQLDDDVDQDNHGQ